MDHISKHIKQTSNNLKKTSQRQSNISPLSNQGFEVEFTKLWVSLEATYANQKFSLTMEGVTGKVARAWRSEFKRNGVGEKELITIRESLAKLKNPEFIPTSLTLINLLKNNECRTHLGQEINPDSLPTEKEILANREVTETIRGECMGLINEILKREEQPKKEKPKSWLEKYAPGPTDRMALLVHNHNKILMSYGKSPLNYPRCAKRAQEILAHQNKKE